MAGFEHGDGETGLGHGQGCGKAGCASAYHNYIGVVRHKTEKQPPKKKPLQRDDNGCVVYVAICFLQVLADYYRAACVVSVTSRRQSRKPRFLLRRGLHRFQVGNHCLSILAGHAELRHGRAEEFSVAPHSCGQKRHQLFVATRGRAGEPRRLKRPV